MIYYTSEGEGRESGRESGRERGETTGSSDDGVTPNKNLIKFHSIHLNPLAFREIQSLLNRFTPFNAVIFSLRAESATKADTDPNSAILRDFAPSTTEGSPWPTAIILPFKFSTATEI